MATLNNVLQFSRAQAQTNNLGLTDTNGILFANEALVDFHRRLVDKGVDASQLQEAYTDGDANVGTYLYPDDMLFLKAIELNYAGTGQDGYQLATQVDVSNISGQNSFSYLRQYASTFNPNFDDRGDWFEIFPTPTTDIPQLMRIFYFLKPTEYTSTSDTIAYPESQDIRILGWRIASSYYLSIGKMAEADMFDRKYQERVTEYCSTLSRGTQQPIQATALPMTGWNF